MASHQQQNINNLKCTVEPPIKDAPNKGHLRIKDTIQSTKKSLSYSAIYHDETTKMAT